MKKGINIWSFPSYMDIRQCIEMAGEAGFESIELSLSETGELSLESSSDEINSFKEYAHKSGVELSSLATGLLWAYPLTSSSSEKRDKAKYIIKKQIDAAAILGVDTILVVPGAVDVDFIPDYEVIEYDVAYERAYEGLLELSSHAEKKKINIGIENVWNKFLLSPFEMRDFIDKINSPFVGSYLDVGNVVATGYPEHWIKILGSRIKKVHFKDYRRKIGSIEGFVDLLAGDVDFKRVVEALESAGYNGYVTAEMIPGYRQHPEQIIFNTSRAMDKILGR